MSTIIKPIGTTSSCNTSTFSSYANSTLVKMSLADSTSVLAVITCKDSSNTTTKWSVSIIGGESFIVQKDKTDIITSNHSGVSLAATPVAYKN
jgi:hypothetical protein